MSDEEAVVHVRTTLRNDQETAQSAELTTRIVNSRGAAVAVVTFSQALDGHAARDLDQQMTVARPALWSPDSPNLYHLVSMVSVHGHNVDEEQTPFGIRSVTLDAAHGLLLNEQAAQTPGRVCSSQQRLPRVLHL